MVTRSEDRFCPTCGAYWDCGCAAAAIELLDGVDIDIEIIEDPVHLGFGTPRFRKNGREMSDEQIRAWLARA